MVGPSPTSFPTNLLVGRQAGPVRATEAKLASPLTGASAFAAVVLLAAVAVGHAEVGRPAPRVQGVDAATGLLAATPAVVLRHAGRKHPVQTTSSVPTSAAAPNGRRTKAALVLPD